MSGGASGGRMERMSLPPDPFESSPLSEPSRGGGTATLEREEQRQSAEPGDHERYAHYVQKDKIMESALTGNPVIALCGKVWIPGRDPQKFPVCPDCKKIYDQMQGGDDS